MKKILALICILGIPYISYSQPDKDDSFIMKYVKDHNYNGTILIEEKGRIIYHNSFGLANREFNIPVNNETRFKIASVTKLFTSVLIMQLYEQGLISLNEPIKTYLPYYKGEAAKKVTIHQLLNHTSGMRNVDTITSQAGAIRNGIIHYQLPFTVDSFISKFCSGSLIHEPGKTFNYNNGEYIILGKIIEEICNKPYEQVLREKILEPVQMQNSGLLDQNKIIENLASTYFMNSESRKLVNDLPVYYQNWFASGAMYSTASDLKKFSDALFENKMIKAETLNLICTPGLDGYGYSVWISEIEVHGKKLRTLFRPGSIMGANAAFYHIFDKDITIILLTNTDISDTDDFARSIATQYLK